MASLVRRHLSNIVLAVIAALLIAVLVVTQRDVTSGERESREDNVLTAFREPEVMRLELERPGERVVLVRSKPADSGLDHWTFEQPYQERADDTEVDDYVSTLGFADVVRRIKPEEVDRAAFGLDAPRLTIRIQMGEIVYELRLGGAAVSPAESAYLEVAGKGAPDPGVVIIAGSLVSQLDQPASHFRGRDLVPYLSVALRTLELSGEGGLRKLVRPTGEGAWDGWRFDGMQGDLRVDRRNLDHVLSQFADLSAESFLDFAKAEAALKGTPSVRIRMVPKKAGSAVALLEVGGKCPDGKGGVVALRRAPDQLAGCVPSGLMEGLTTPAASLVDRHLFDVEPDEVESLVVSQGGKRLELARKGTGFVMRAPQEGEIDGALGNQRLAQLCELRGEIVEAPDKAALGLAPPYGSVQLKVVGRDAQVEEHEVAVSRPDADGNVHVLRLADQGVLKLGREAARLLVPDSTLVRKREVLAFERRDLKQIQIDGRAGYAQRLERQEDGTFELSKPAAIGHDAGLVTELVDTLASLTAERWVSDEDDGSFGLAAPSLKLSVELYPQGEEKAKRHSLVLGAQAPGGVYASFAGDPGVFVLPRRVDQVLQTWLIDRSLLMLEPKEAERIRLTRGKQTWVFKQDGGRFVLESGELDATRVEQIVEQLSLTRAEAAVHLGPALPAEGFAEPALVVEVERLPARGERSTPIKLSFGAGDTYRGVSIYYARRAGINATFALARGRLQPILDAL